MSDLVEEAVRVLRELPENVQEAAARGIMDYCANYETHVQ
jgi:hypothetical protein